MRTVIIGAGKIGCAYLCTLFLDAGWGVTLVAHTEAYADAMLAAGSFRVRKTGGGSRNVRGYRVVPARTPEFDDAIAGADLVVTSVGVGNVSGLGPDLARALAGREGTAPLQVLLAENQDSAPVLERAVNTAAADLGLELPPVAFAGGVPEVVVARGDWETGCAEFVRDKASRLWIDRTRLIKPLPTLPGIYATPYYQARLQEKLFVFNAGHALCAYLGSLRGHRFIDEAVRDPVLHPLVAGCLLEARSALLTRHPTLSRNVRGAVAQVLKCYANADLADPVHRVARDPIRKLAPSDRLLGPANLIRAVNGGVPAHFALGIAGALLYRNPVDRQASRLGKMLTGEGLAPVLKRVCGLEPQDELAQAVERRYRGFVLSDAGALFPPVREAHEPPATGEAAGL